MIRLKDAEKTYENGTKAVRGISFQIDDGEFVFLVGPSGSGKSTIIKILTAELQPTEGSVHVNGFALEKIRSRAIPYLRRTLGVIFQDFRLIENKSVYDNVAFAMRVVGASPKAIKKRVPYILGLVGLQHKAKHYPTEMSGGERQRLSIARAILKNSPILLLDEATASLDIENELAVKQAIANLLKEKKTVVMIAHTLSIVKNADQILVVSDGRIIEAGTHEELLAKDGKYAAMWNAEQKITV